MKQKAGIKYISRTLIEGPYIGLCQSKKDYKKEMRRLKVSKREQGEWVSTGMNGTLHTFTHPRHGITCIVCISQKKREPRYIIEGLLVHEAVHAWQKIKRDIGEDTPGDEFEAYSIQAIACRLIEAYKFPPAKSGGKK